MAARGGSPIPPALDSAPQVPPTINPIVRRLDTQRFCRNIVTARTTSDIAVYQGCLFDSRQLVQSWLDINRTSGRQTEIFSEMMEIINTIRDTIDEFYSDSYGDEDAYVFDYVDPYTVRLNNKYVELVDHAAEISE
jgi:hypothetical protein